MTPGRDRLRTAALVTALAAIGIIAGAGLYFRSAGESSRSVRGESAGVSRAAMERFRSLPYVTRVADDPQPGIRGVGLYKRGPAWPGLNLLTSNEVGGAHILDMDGRVLHSYATNDSIGDKWLFSKLNRDGSVLVIVAGYGLVKMDWDSNVLWVSRPEDSPLFKDSTRPRYHHDFDFTESGGIITLAKEIRRVRYPSQKKRAPYEIRDNSIVIMSADGIPLKKISLNDVLGEAMEAMILRGFAAAEDEATRRRVVATQSYDVFHANTVEVIDRDIGVAHRGDVLFCVRNLDLIGIMDLESERMVWSWGPGVIQRPHDPVLLDNGNILIFDNGLPERGYSRIIELDPVKEEIVWQYEAEPRESFFSDVMGGNERLPNGNTLITESTRGLVFEVTQAGETVWEFSNFEGGEDGEGAFVKATIYRMLRYGPDYLTGTKRLKL
jgi:hypothetical protein